MKIFPLENDETLLWTAVSQQKPRDFSRLKLRLRPFCPWPRRAASSAGEATWNSNEPICERSTMAVVVEWKSCDEANEAFVFLPPLQTGGTLLRCPTSARCPTWRIKPGRVDLEINASWIINLKCSFNPLFCFFFLSAKTTAHDTMLHFRPCSVLLWPETLSDLHLYHTPLSYLLVCISTGQWTQ